MAAAPIWRLSGGSSNSAPASSLGGVMSTTTLAAGTLYDDVTGDEAGTGDVEYRGVYVLNNGNQSLQGAVVWIEVQTPDPDTSVAIGLAVEGANATMATVANEQTAPASVTFSQPGTR